VFTEIYQDAEDRMRKAIDVLKADFNSIRAGRANPALLDRLSIDYYGTPTPVKQLATISAPEPRLLIVQPWDKSILPEVEKAILRSDLGLTPSNDGAVIRLAIPQLTEERRAELVKVVRKKAEEARVAIRNVRRDVNELIKKMQKNGEISEDDERRAQEEIQKITDKFIKVVDEQLGHKEAEIMEV